MRIMPVDPRTLAEDEVTVLHDILTAVARHDHPDFPAPAKGDLEAKLARPWPGCRTACWLGFEDERAVGLAWVTLLADANSAVADLTLAVVPHERCQGAGRSLLREAVRLAYSTGRTTMISEAADLEPAVDFAGSIGARPALHEVHQVLQVPPVVAGLEAVPLGDYELVRLRGAAPPELRAGLGAVHEGMVDAPLGDTALAHQPYDGARVAAVDVILQARGLVQLRVLARHLGTGEIVGVTYVIVSPRSPHRSEQGDTTVLPGHRGHRLGLAMKTEMLCWLGDEYPEVRELSTWVARNNAPMLNVNERLEYRVVAHWTQWQAPVRELAGKLGLV